MDWLKNLNDNSQDIYYLVCNNTGVKYGIINHVWPYLCSVELKIISYTGFSLNPEPTGIYSSNGTGVFPQGVPVYVTNILFVQPTLYLKFLNFKPRPP